MRCKDMSQEQKEKRRAGAMERMRKWRLVHHDEIEKFRREHHDEHRAKEREKRKKWRENMSEEQKERARTLGRERMRKWRENMSVEQKERARARAIERNKKEEGGAKRREWNNKNREKINKWLKEDVNHNGVPKNLIRRRSQYILSKCHAKLPGYEIHHCFGYENPDKFIYVPKKLHRKIIHPFLDKIGIQADSNHWNAIRDIVNSCEEYTYIRC